VSDWRVPDVRRFDGPTLDRTGHSGHSAPVNPGEILAALAGRGRLVGIPWHGRMLGWLELQRVFRDEMIAAGRVAELNAVVRRLRGLRGIEVP